MVFPKIPVLDKTSWLKIASHYVFDSVGSLAPFYSAVDTGPAPLLPRRSRLALPGIYEFLEAEDCLYLGKPDRSGRQDRENESRAHSSRLQTGAHRRPRQLLRATNAIECLHEEFRRRTRTQYLLPNPESACTPCWVLLANGGRGHATPYGRLDQAPRAARHHHA